MFLPFPKALEIYKAELKVKGQVPPRELTPVAKNAIRKIQGVKPKKICNWCAGPCPGRKRDWCSDECVARYMIVANQEPWIIAALEAEGRDKCACCGLDPWKFVEDIRKTSISIFERQLERLAPYVPQDSVEEFVRNPNVANLVALYNKVQARNLFHIDHIIPVIEGGGLCSIENFQILCLSCHKNKTASEAARRAALRRVVRDKRRSLDSGLSL